MISLGSVSWGSSPVIPIQFAYEKQRSGANMQYRVQVTVSALSGSSYFGYPIYLNLSINGKSVTDVTVKAASPTQWSSAIVYTSGWYTVSNKTSGTTPVAFKVYSGMGSTRNNTYSYSMGVDPAGSKLSASNGTLGTALTLSVTRYNSGFTDTITYKCGSASGTIRTKTSDTSIAWNSTYGNTVALAAQNTTGRSVSVTFTITTYSGTTSVGSDSVTVSMAIPSSVKPSVSLKVEDTTGLLATYGAYVQGHSKLKITATPTLAYSSPIKSYSITADGSTYTYTPVTTGAIKGKGTLSITAKVTDKREYPSDTVTSKITVLEYSKPAVSVIAYRCNSSGTRDQEGAYMRIGFNASVSSLNGKNSASYSISYGGTPITGSGLSYLSGAIACDVASVRSIEVKVTDKLDSTTKSAVIPIAFTLMDFYYTGKGVAVGKVATRDGFDCSMNAYFNSRRLQEIGLAVDDTDAVNVNYLKSVGLGRAKWIEWADVDTIMSPGWYRSKPDGEFDFGGIKWSTNVWFRVDAYSDDAGCQTFYLASQEGYVVRRTYTSQAWNEFGCVNPPLNLGVQYRTTEKYLNKPVYIKLVDFGTLPNAANKNVAYYSAGSTGVIDIKVMLSDGCLLGPGYGRNRSFNLNSGMYVDCTKYNVRIFTEADFSSLTAYALVKYTID